MKLGPACLVALSAVASVGPSAAQTTAGLRLDDVIAATLARSPMVLEAQQAEEIGRGAVMAAAGPFDLEFGTLGARSQAGTTDPVTGVETLTTQVNYGVSLRKQFRQGPLVATQVTAAQSSLASAANAAQSRLSVRLNVLVPLRKDRSGMVTSAPERATRSEHEASVLALRHTTADALYAATVAYWDYLAAFRRVQAQESAEERARRLVDETRVLVAADERTASDLNQMLAHLASRRVLRMSAEVALLDARLRLGLRMGLTSDEITALPAGSTDFPVPGPAAWTTSPARLVELASAMRADLVAADLNLRAARTRAEAAQHDVQPRLDLHVGVGYTGLTSGRGVTPFLSALYRNVPGIDASVQIQHELFTSNVEARGRLLSALARQQQFQIAQDELRRQIAASVQVAYEAFGRNERAVTEAGTAVRLFETTVQNEQRKFQLGVSTLFDVIQAEDGLTSAMLGEIASRQDYAKALAALRFQTGTLPTADPRGPVVRESSLLTPP